MADRVSQEAVEVLDQSSVSKVRVSQEAVEALDQSSVLRVRLSQLATEVLDQKPVTTIVALSQLAVEVLCVGVPGASGVPSVQGQVI